MKFVIAIIVIIALLALYLQRRGASGVGKNGSTDTVEGSLGQQAHHHGQGGGLGGS